MNSEKLTGTVTDIVYQNPENGYTVCEISNKQEGIFTAVGYMPYLSVGESLEMEGSWIEHPDYGEQFKINEYRTVLPTDERAILQYLSSGIIAGIGEATAKNIVAHFGNETLNVMLNTPAKLAEIKGISPKRAEKIGQAFYELQSMQGIVIYLQQFNIGASIAMRAQKALGSAAVERIKENPYILVDFVDGVGFKKADEIAFFQGIAKNSPVRIKHGIKYIMTEDAYSTGNTYIEYDELVKKSVEVLQITADEAENGIAELGMLHSVKLEENFGIKSCMLMMLYSAEEYCAERLIAISNHDSVYNLTDEEFEKAVKEFESKNDFELTDEQRRAVKTAVCNSCMVITGGPGTGKTTIIKSIIEIYKALNMEVELAAPTGRAAKRISEMSGDEAKTIHRMLGMKQDEFSENGFLHNESNTLTADAFIIDEASMIDVSLMNSLLRAIKLGAKVILCGDADQLPSVGPGNVLHDIIASEQIPTIKLSKIFRQAEKSLIVRNAHKINAGEMPIIDDKKSDFFFLHRNSGEIVAQTVAELYKVRLPKSYNINPVAKIQVLTPSKKGPCGTAALNKELQYAVNPPDMLKAEYKHGNTIFRVGDKVMQIKNDYDAEWIKSNGEFGTGIFNGDIGIIESISLKDKQMLILFDDEREVEYPFINLDRLELAYAVTVHKSQGSGATRSLVKS